MPQLSSPSQQNDLQAELQELKLRLQEAEDTIDAIRHGTIDALVVKSDQKQQIYTLQSADYTYRVLIESMNQGALTINDKGIILYSNNQMSVMLNRPLEQIIGSRIESLFLKQDNQPLSQSISRAKSNTPADTLVCTLDAGPKVSVLLSVTKLPELEDDADICIVLTDITERKRAEDAKDEFISLASHQLRTPATAVKQYLGMLIQGYGGVVPEKQLVFLRTAYNSNERQLGIVNDILKTAQIDSGSYRLERTEIDVAKLIHEIVAEMEPVLAMKSQHIRCTVNPKIAAKGDANDIKLALINLIENSSKYSDNQTTIYVRVVRSNRYTDISVRDEGVGIATADSDRIFEKFTRVQNRLSDTVNGSGLGLYWVRRIVELHGGSIKLTSSVNAGTTFTIRLPSL